MNIIITIQDAEKSGGIIFKEQSYAIDKCPGYKQHITQEVREALEIKEESKIIVNFTESHSTKEQTNENHKERFEEIAEIIRASTTSDYCSNQPGDTYCVVKEELIKKLSTLLSLSNPRFDKSRFKVACYKRDK